MIDIDMNKIIEELDEGTFKALASKEENDKFYNSINDLVISTKDKYPKKIESCMNFPQVHVAKKISKLTNSNIIRLFDDKKDSKLLAQYSYNEKGILFEEDLEAIKSDECAVYMLSHTDMDGDASGSLVFNTLHNGDNIKITRFNYDYKVLDELILKVNIDKARYPEKRFILFIVDLSIKTLYMTMLLSTFNKVIWIDHHAGSLPTVNELESGSFLDNTKKACITSDFSYVLDTRISATQLALLWLKPYISKIKEGVEVDGYKLSSLISVYDLKMDKKYPEAYKKSLYMNQFYWDYNTLYVFTTFWEDSFTKEYEIESLTRMLVCGKYLWELNQKKLKMLYRFDHKYNYKIDFHNGSTLNIRAIYGTGNNSRFIDRPPHKDTDYEITLLIRYTNTPAILSMSGYTSDDFVKEMGINNIFGMFGVGQGHPGAAGMRISRHDVLKMALESIFRVDDIDKFPYFKSEEEYDNVKIKMGLDKFNIDSLIFLDDFKEQINKQFNTNKSKKGAHDLRFEPEIDVLVRCFALIFATNLYGRM